jgi:hypothetical protein
LAGGRQLDLVAIYRVRDEVISFAVTVRDEVGRCETLEDVYEIPLEEHVNPRQVLHAAICRQLDPTPPPLGIPRPPMSLEQQLHLIRNGGWPAGMPFWGDV